MNLSTWQLIRSDYRADARNPKGVLLCVLYRVAHSVTHWPKPLAPLGLLIVGGYKLITEYILGSEIHWRAIIGPELRIYHGYGLVIHSNVKIGSGCVLRQGVTLGSKDEAGQLVPSIGDNVDFGASAIVIGSHKIGNNAKIGAGAVVVRDVPEAAVAVGNPARLIIPERGA